MSESSMRPTTTSVDEFIAAQPTSDALSRVDAVISAALPGASRQLWEGVLWGGSEQSIIGYGDIEQPRPKGKTVSWFLVGLAQQKNYLSIYVNAADDRRYLAAVYGPRLGKVKIGSASVSFKSVDDIDLEVLDEMVRHAGRTIT